jgi:hypothetical protein
MGAAPVLPKPAPKFATEPRILWPRLMRYIGLPVCGSTAFGSVGFSSVPICRRRSTRRWLFAPVGGVGISPGVVVLRTPGGIDVGIGGVGGVGELVVAGVMSYEEVLNLADNGLRQAKAAGKNQAVGMIPSRQDMDSAVSPGVNPNRFPAQARVIAAAR